LTPLSWSSDETTLADAGSRSAASGSHEIGFPTGASRSSSTAWLTSTDAIDHGRFAPGALLEGRYRIVGRLGRGGMGEVFRADDLKLGQPVALKFLPEAVDKDPARLTQLHMEVRMARQVSHPNVCRVYDVAEYEGHTFLSMEYVDGEDLASLIRRIGRLPQDRAMELARQICAGLAAAHDRGVVHRDLKPANIMLDGNGTIRVTDFGLAGAAGESLLAGTPAYMSPEQLAGGEVTPRSDLYALGLVLFELFTGHRALEGNNLAELIAKREQAGITRPSEFVRDLDPAIERAIMRCLESDSSSRPSSALAVAAALPGGDPLAAALAAGETPSPEMVAAAGESSALQPVAAVAALAATLGVLALCVALADRVLLTNVIPLPKPPLLLAERAKEILGSLGFAADAVDSAYGFNVPDGAMEYLRNHPELATREHLSTGTPRLLQFWWRGSPSILIPTGDKPRVTLTDPPLSLSGMTLVKLDPDGRLLELAVVPAQVDPESKPATVDWTPLFRAAGLDYASFSPAVPQWTPRVYADARAAWTGPLSGLKDQPLRIEAAAYHGRAVAFQQIAPWTRATRLAEVTGDRPVSIWSALGTLAVFSLFVAAALVARHNLRKGRGDRRGALQLATFVSIVAFGVWLLDSKHVANPDIEMGRFFSGQPLWAAGMLWLLYLAIEPYVRRFWPTTVVSWSRLMARQWRDPLVGRDILFAVALGITVHVIYLAHLLTVHAFGYALTPDFPDLGELLGTHIVIARVLNQVFNAVLNALFSVFGMVFLKILVRRELVAGALAVALMTFTSARGMIDSGPVWLVLITLVVFITIIVLTIQHLGLLAAMVLFLVNFIISNAIVTFDASKWFFWDSLLLMMIPAVLACYGFYISRGGEPLLGRRLLD
jgi:serine/threonine-protein kinase